MESILNKWNKEQERRERPCCRCIEPRETPVHHSLLGKTEEEAKQDRQRRKKLVQNCCGSDPEEHHRSCRYYKNEEQAKVDWVEELKDLEGPGDDAGDC